MIDERQEVVRPLPQGRQFDGDDLQTIIEVFAEAGFKDLFFEVLVGGAHPANVHGPGPGLAEPPDLPVLEHAEEFRLEGKGQVPDLVQEKGPAVGFLDEADLVPRGPRERPSGIAEELALQEVVGNGPAIDGDEFPGPPRARLMDGPGHQLLSGAAFTGDENGGAAVFDPVDKGPHPQEAGVLPDKQGHPAVAVPAAGGGATQR